MRVLSIVVLLLCLVVSGAGCGLLIPGAQGTPTATPPPAGPPPVAAPGTPGAPGAPAPPQAPPPTATVVAGATAVATPPAAVSPTISNLTPAPNSTVPAGPTVLAANVSSDTVIAQLDVFLDGNQIDVEVLGPSAEQVSFFTEPTLSAGAHTVRVATADQDGDTSQAQWSFTSQ